MKYYLAIDIGASSGRHIVGYKENGELKTVEVYRFETGFIEQNGHLVNDIDKLWGNVLEGAKVAFSKYPEIESLAIDTWGVDYVLMNGDKEIYPVYAYRDWRTKEPIEKVHSIIPFNELYSITGIQFQTFNTIYQLYADKLAGRLDGATDFLMLPEYLSYKFTGVKKHEYTNATTMGMVNASACEYDETIISRLGLPKKLFHKLSAPGTVVGEFFEEIKAYVGGNAKVILCASHDTASAVEGIPMNDSELYLSSGTWSLLGCKIEKALTGGDSYKANYSNEGGVGYVRYLKNIMGMWIVNNLRKELCPDKPFPQIVEEARSANYQKTVDVNAEVFLAPKSMKEAFDSVLGETLTEAQYFDCAFKSLALGYKNAIAELEGITGKKYHELYIVGGGAKNGYLNELTEKACGVKVVALPIEATAIGNLKIQMK